MSATAGDDYEPIRLGAGEPEGGGVVIGHTAEGGVVLPTAYARLAPEDRELVAACQRAALLVQDAQEHLDDMVQDLRAAGISWGLIGWCTGLSDRGAKLRWTARFDSR